MNNTTTNNNITTNNKGTKTMITIEMTEELLKSYKAVKQENRELKATLENNEALKSEVNNTEIALLKRILDIQTAIEAMEKENESLKKAVSEEGDLQMVLSSYKLSSNILDEIEEMMTAPEKVKEVDSTKIPICAGVNVTALLSALKQPSPPLPPLRRPNPPTSSVKPVEIPQPQKQTVTTVEADSTVETPQLKPVSKKSTSATVANQEPMVPLEELIERAYKSSCSKDFVNTALIVNQSLREQADLFFQQKKNKAKVVHNVTSDSFPILSHKLSDGTVVNWKEARLSKIVLAVDEEGNNLTEDIIDFLDEFLNDENFDASEPYAFETHTQFRRAVVASEQVKEVPFILKTAEYVHYLIKSFFCTNQVAENELSKAEIFDAKVMLDQRAYLKGCSLHPSNCF